MIETRTAGGFWKDFDWLLLAAALGLSAISLTEIYSSTMNLGGNTYLFKQLAWICVGLVFMFVVASVDYHFIAEHVPWLYLASLGVLIYTRLMAREIAGARSWLELGPASIQPSEVIKMVVVVAMARYLSELRVERYLNLGQLIRAGVICGLPVGLIVLQPDLGTALTYLPILVVGIFLRGVKPKAI